MSAFLDRLESVKKTGRDSWIARCPSHRDKSPSLAIRECDDGRVLVHCFAGCDAQSILGAVGLDYSALFPEKPKGGLYVKNPRRPFIPSDVFEIARLEIGTAAVIAADMHKGRAVSETDYARLFTVARRLDDIASKAYGSR